MEMPESLNAAMRYIEDNLCGEIDNEKLARIACTGSDGFQRFFSYMTGMSLGEYVRKRRLTLAGFELQNGDARIIDVAVKYGYDSADSFARAFFRQHGLSPAAARKGGPLRAFPPASFRIIIRGAKDMEYRLIDVPEMVILGISREFDGQEFATREALRGSMWDEKCANVPGQLCEGRWNESGNHAYDGEWYGLWRGGRYMIGREREMVKDAGLEAQTIAPGRYAVFSTKQGAAAWEALPELFELIFGSWLPDSGYELRNDDIIEVYHLWTDAERRRRERYYEVWIPVK